MNKDKYLRLKTAISNLVNASFEFKGTKKEQEQLEQDHKILLELIESCSDKVEKKEEQVENK